MVLICMIAQIRASASFFCRHDDAAAGVPLHPLVTKLLPLTGHIASYKLSPFRTGKAYCFVANDTCGAMSVRRASRHHTCYASCGVRKRKASSRPIQILCPFPFQSCSEGTILLCNLTQATKGRCVGWDDGSDIRSRRGNRHPRCIKLARREREALEKIHVNA